MPFIAIPSVVARSNTSRRRMLQIFQETLNDYGGQELDTYTMRAFLNMGVTKAATLVRKIDSESYRDIWVAFLETEPTATNNKPYSFLNLKTPFVQTAAIPGNAEQNYPPTWNIAHGSIGMVPWAHIHRVEHLGVDEYTPTKAAADINLWRGLAEEVTYPVFSAVANGLNDQWRQSRIWTVRSGRIEVFDGADIVASGAWEPNSRVQLTVIRKPILDTLKAYDDVENNLDTAADLPDEAIPLAIEYAKNMALVSRGRPIDPTQSQAEQLLEQSFLMTFGNYAPDTQQ